MKMVFNHIQKSILRICLTVSLLLLFVGCYNTATGEVTWGPAINFKLPAFPETGSHQVMVFSEMHYSPSYRSQEVPRILPPEGSVPITGAELVSFEIEEIKEWKIPENVKSNFDFDNAAKIYNYNCAVCHGTDLQGQGPITVSYTHLTLPTKA